MKWFCETDSYQICSVNSLNEKKYVQLYKKAISSKQHFLNRVVLKFYNFWSKQYRTFK